MQKKIEYNGAGEILLTSMDKDGTKSGYDVDLLKTITKNTSIPVIASGGVSSIKDLQLLKERASENIEGVICGRALYNGAIDLKEALRALNS